MKAQLVGMLKSLGKGLRLKYRIAYLENSVSLETRSFIQINAP